MTTASPSTPRAACWARLCRTDWHEIQGKECDIARAQSREGERNDRWTVFPNETFPYYLDDEGLDVPLEEIRKGGPAPYRLMVVGCVYYLFVSDNTPHRTRFVGELSADDPKRESQG